MSEFSRDKAFQFAIQNKSFSLKEKVKVFNLLQSYYGCFMREVDVLSLFDEMKKNEKV